MTRMRGCGVPFAVTVVSLALAGCGSPDHEDVGNSLSTTSSVAATTTKAPYARSIVDYIKQNGITETAIRPGDPGAPQIRLPLPPGWAPLGTATPAYAWDGIALTKDNVIPANPSTIIAVLSKLSGGGVDAKKVLEYASGEIKNLPGYEGDANGSPSKLGDFDAWEIGGTYMKEGVKRAVAQKTVVIPVRDGLFVLQLNADGAEDQMVALRDATTVIDKQAVIRPAP